MLKALLGYVAMLLGAIALFLHSLITGMRDVNHPYWLPFITSILVEIVAIVTSALWTPDTTPTPMQFPSPEEIPGVVYISRVITLQVGGAGVEAR